MSAISKTVPPPVNPLLARYLASLAARPLYTKAVTAGTLGFFQEVLANHIAGVPVYVPKDAPPPRRVLAAAKIDVRALKIAAYGFFISAPMGHVLVGTLQKAFAGKTGSAARIGQLLANNLIVAPIQTFVYLACMSIIGGAYTTKSIMGGVKAGYMKVLKVTWATSPLAVLIAQKYLDPQLWVLFFNLVSFALGTTFNVIIKKAKLKALANKQRKEREADK